MTYPQVGSLRETESRNRSNRSNWCKAGQGNAASRAARHPQLESLESRQLLSVAPHDPSAWTAARSAHDDALPFFIPPQSHLSDAHGGLLTEPVAGDPRQIAVSYLRANAPLLGVTQADIDTAVVTDQYTDAKSGVTHLYFAQTLDGLRVANANLNINLTADGRVINAGSSFVGGLDRTATAVRSPALDARAAVAAAGQAFGLKGSITVSPPAEGEALLAGPAFEARSISLDRITPRLMYVPQASGSLELSWNMQLRTPDGQHWYDAAVSAKTGELLWASDWADGASYNVLPEPIESPHDGGRIVVENPHDPVASPFGWHDTNGVEGAEFTDTRGNNVSAQEDADANDSGGFRPSGGAELVFDFPFDTTQDPASYREAAITNLFYWNNLLHDVHYHYGFDEVSGNFQVNNYGNGGLGDDPVQADAQDGSGTNNANMFTPPDGFSPRMQQFLFDITSPRRDSSLSNDIIVHEYGHGVSNRLTGGPANSNALNALQSGGMGEGWSDWWSLMFSQDSSDTKFAAYPVGTYVLGQPENGQGIRRFPYSFDMSINPLTLGVYNQSAEVHDSGEIWTSALWDMNWLLIDKYGYEPNIALGYQGEGSAGNLLALHLVMDGLKLQPANPTFTDARDAIVLADAVLTGGANAKEIWTAFARRGFGLSADVDDGSGANSFTVIEAFDMPIFDLHVTTTSPADGEIVGAPPTVFNVDMSQVFDPNTADAADFKVNGISATAVQVLDSNSLRFTFAATPVTVQGAQTMTMAEGALLRASDGADSLDFSRTFRYDTLRMAVTATAPGAGASVVLPMTSVDVNLNEAFDPASLQTTDLSLSHGQVTGVEAVDGDTVRFHISGLNREGTLSFQFAAGAFTDGFGNPSLPYSGAWELDFGTVPFSGEFHAVSPYGALAYEGDTSGIIGVNGDTDTFTLSLEAGQTIAFRGTSDAGWQPRLTVRNAQGGVVASGGGGADGVLLLPAVAIAAAGNYSIEIGAPAGRIGAYAVAALLNADYETELLGGATNDTRATAQSLEGLFNSPDGVAERAMVIGRAPSAGDMPVEIEPNQTTSTPNSLSGNFIESPEGAYQLFIDGEQNNSTDVDWFNLGTLDAGDIVTFSMSGSSSGRGGLIDPIMFLYQMIGGVANYVAGSDDDGPGYDPLLYRFVIPSTGVYMVVAEDYGGFETGSYDLTAYLENVGSAPLTGGAGINEVEGNNTPETATDMSASWRPVVRQSITAGTIASFDDIDVFRATLSTGDLVTIDVQGFDGFQPYIELVPSRGVVVSDTGFNGRAGVYTYRAPSGGSYFFRVNSGFGAGDYELRVELSSATPPPAAAVTSDYYSVDLESGQSLSLMIDATDDRPIELALQDALGNVLAVGAAEGFGTDLSISDFVAPAAGTYYVAIEANRAPGYRLLAARDVTIEQELNDAISEAQLVESRSAGGSQRVLGRLAPSTLEVTTYSELPFQSVDNLNFNHVTYDFKVNGVDSFDAYFGSFGPGVTKFGDGIGLEGTASGILALDFEAPTSNLQFGILLSTFGTIPDGVVTNLFDANGQLIAAVPLVLRDEGFFYSEALFSYQGAPVARAELDFAQEFAVRFFLDNLKYEFDPDVDLFPVTVAELGTLILETETPGDAAGAPSNALNPRLRLLDALGNVVAQDDNSAADGRNARLEFVIPRGVNTYYIEVSPAESGAASRGDYLLHITNPASIPAPYEVTAVTPADGEKLRYAPTTIDVTFGGNFLVSSLSASDLLLDGVPATGMTLVDGARVRFALPPGMAEGMHTITIEAGALSDLQGTPLAAFSSQFELDLTAPRIVGSSIAAGDVLPLGSANFTITFAEPMRVANLSADDLFLTGTYKPNSILPTALAWDASGTILSAQFNGLWEDDFTLTLLSGDGAFEDVVGIDMDGEIGAFPVPPNQTGDGIEGGSLQLPFHTDVVTGPFAVPLKPVGPRGSLSFGGLAEGIMSFADDTDELVINLEAGQVLTLTAAVPNMQSSFSLRGPNGALLGAASATSVGGEAVLRTRPVAIAGQYTIAFSTINGALGPFSLRALLNADLEMEHHGGTTNGERASAQNLSGAFIDVGAGASAANVLGRADLPTGLLPVEQEPNNSLESANVASSNFSPATERYQLSIQGELTGGRTGVDWYAIGSMNGGDVLTVNVAGVGSGRGTLAGARLELYTGNAASPILVASDSFGSGSGGDALISQYAVVGPGSYYVAIIYDGFNVGSYALTVLLENTARGPRTDQTLETEVEPNDTAGTANVASASWRSLNYQSATRGEMSAVDSDQFAYDFQAGDLVTTIVNVFNGFPDTRLTWRGPDGEVLGFDDGFSALLASDSALLGLRIPATGRYTLEVQGSGSGGYFANVFLASPTAPPAPAPSRDYYRLQLAAGESIAVAVKAFAGADSDFSIENAAGQTLITSNLSTDNFGKVIPAFVAPSAGVYYVVVNGGTGEEYSLSVVRSAGLDLEDNDSRATAQAVPSSGVVLGAIRAGNSRLFAVAADGSSAIVELDPVTGAEINRITVPGGASGGPDGLAFSGTSLFYINGFGSQELYEIDPDTGAILDVDYYGFGNFDSLAYLNGRVYIGDYGFSVLYEIDPESDTLIKSIPVSGYAIVGGIAGAADPDRIIATADYGLTVIEIDPVTGSVTPLFNALNVYGGVAVVGDEIYLGSLYAGPVIDVYTRAGAYTRTINTPFVMSALGGDASSPNDDWYRFDAVAGQILLASLTTPGDRPGEFDNRLNPAMELYDSNGQLVATNYAGPDARGGPLSRFTPAGGTFYLRVFSAANSGEYVLHVRNVEVPAGDTDFDGDVDLDDLNNVRNNLGGTGVGDTAPFDGDVDLDDLNSVRNNFGYSGAPAAVKATRTLQGVQRTEAVDALFTARERPSSSQSADELFALIGSGETRAIGKKGGRRGV